MKRTLGEVCRLINVIDVLYYLGDLLYRRSLRYSVFTAAVSLLGFLGNFIPGVETYPARVAIALPLAVGGAALLGGLLLKLIPSLIATRLISAAEAQDLDLMEDYRKAQQPEHLEALWQRVYRFEWALGSAAARVRPDAAECPARILADDPQVLDPAERAKQQFMVRARFALERTQPQPRQRYYLGLDLRFLEDWRNGAPFDRNDNKLVEQFHASAVLEAVKREVGYGRLDALRDLLLRISHRFWFTMITRVMSIQVGEAVCELNERYQTDYFNTQVILWPGEDEQPWMDQFPSAREEVCRWREKILARVFGPTDGDARRMLDRFALPSFRLATKLRVRYDPEYLDGGLGYDVLGDLEALDMRSEQVEPFREFRRRAIAQHQALKAFLEYHHPELLLPRNAEALRAVRIAVHTDREGVGLRLAQYAQLWLEQPELAGKISPIIQRAANDRERYSSHLVALRTHHELTRLHYLGYKELLGALRCPRRGREKTPPNGSCTAF